MQQIIQTVATLHKQMVILEVIGYYNCVTILTMQFYECSDENNSCSGS